MVNGEFKRKKIDSLTLGERMKKIRSERRLSLNEISKSTKIQAKYLEYLENGEYLKLPADVYVKGFLKSYAAYAGVNEKALVKSYEREQRIQKNIKKIENKEKFIEPLSLSKWAITPKIIIGLVIALFVFLGFFYLYREVDSFISDPRLVITSPQDGEEIEGRSVNVKGFTEKDSEVFINDQPVLASDNGEFGENVVLQGGLNVITVKSKNKFDKESVRSISVRSSVSEDVSENSQGNEEKVFDQEKKIDLEITVRPGPAWLSVEADGNIVFSGTLLPDSVQKFEAREKISVSSGKGNNTYIKVNGKDAGALSNEPGIVRDVIFTP